MDLACANPLESTQASLGKILAKSMPMINIWWVHTWAQAPCSSTEILTFYRWSGVSQVLNPGDPSPLGSFWKQNEGSYLFCNSCKHFPMQSSSCFGRHFSHQNRKPILHDWKMLKKAKCCYLNSLGSQKLKQINVGTHKYRRHYVTLPKKRPKLIFYIFNE